MRKILLFISFSFLLQLDATENLLQYYSSELQKVVKAVEKLPAARDLIERVQSEGGVSVAVSRRNNLNFSAYWESQSRQITLNLSYQRSFGTLIRSLLFELHNAASNSQFEELYRRAMSGTISREQYILGMERIEYSNCLKTSELLRQGIKLGIFPAGVDWYIPSSFQRHYEIQCSGGHAQYHGRNYDRMSPRRGTLRA